MFHVKHYCIGCPFMAIPEMSAVVLLPSSSPPSWVVTVAFSGNFRDAQFCCEQDVQPRLVLISSFAGIKPMIAVTDLRGNNK